jgi:hypothetical protein
VTWRDHIRDHFSDEARYTWNERAAIREYDGKTARPEADLLAYLETCRLAGYAPKEADLQVPLPLLLGKQRQ